MRDIHPGFQLDRAVDHEVAGPDIDVITRSAPQIFHEEAGLVVTEIEHEACFLQCRIKIGVLFANAVVNRNLKLVHDPVGQGGENEIGLARGHAVCHRPLGIEVTEAYIHQRVGFDDMGGGPLQHGNVGAGLPERCADIMRRVVGADHHDLPAGIGVRTRMLRGMLLLALEDILSGEFRDIRLAGHAGCQHQLFRPQHDLLAGAVDNHGPLTRHLVILG